MKKFLFLLIVGLSLSSTATAEMLQDTRIEIESRETAQNPGEAADLLEWLFTSSDLKSANTGQEANVLIKEEIDEQAGKVNKTTLAVMAAAAVFAYWLNKKKKQEFD
ncbi:hypothetical protein PO902_00905 [Planococcus maritimus]|nr:hypothetical protein [Planococcus sp. SK3692]MDE4083636.1 hypothetical protein [Planococcus maritimus]